MITLLSAKTLPIDSATITKASKAVEGLSKPIITEGFSLSTLLTGWETVLINFGIRLLLAIALFFVGRWIIGYIRRVTARLMERKKLEGVAVSLVNSLLVASLYIALGVSIAGTLGIQSVSFAAVLASMGLAVGMALSGQLQNLAGGVIILVTKPFTIGNYIQAQGVEGTVKRVSLFHSVVSTMENKTVYIPNGSLSSGVIVNFNEANTRRIEWVIGIDYEADVDRALALLRRFLERDERVLQDPVPLVAIKALSPSSVDLVVRAWVKTEDFLDVMYSYNKTVLKGLPEEGINFPFPQVTVSQR